MEKIPFGLTFIQAIQAIGVIVIALAFILVVIVFAFDKLNVKSFSIRNGFSFYQDGETKRSRITHRSKTVARKRKVTK